MSSKTPERPSLSVPKEHRAIFASIAEDLLPAASTPFGQVAIPPLKTMVGGSSTCRRVDSPVLRGYFSGLHHAKHAVFHVNVEPHLFTTETFALEVDMPHLAVAEGNVILLGLGLGFALYNLVLNPKVQKVIVIEQSMKVVNAFKVIANYRSWSADARSKIEIRVGAGTEARLQDVENPTIDFLYVAESKLMDTYQVHDAQRDFQDCRPKPRAFGFAGQELRYIEWCLANDQPHDQETSWIAYKAFTGLPLTYAANLTFQTYGNLCYAAYENSL